MPRYSTAAMSVSLLALALAGCSKSAQDLSATSASPSPDSGLPALPAALPMQTGPANRITTAPPAAALPAPRRYVGVSRFSNDREAYAYLDRASDTEDEIGDAPPDYDYDYDGGVRPWVWETDNGDYQYAEPVDGGYRYYYYQPGADYPYLVRTRDYSYAYAGGALVAIYALSGALLPPDQYGRYRDQASRIFWRGQQLRQYSDRRPHQGVIAANWAAQRPQFSAAQSHWASARAQQPAWQSYHAQNDPSHQPGWQQEHQQRQQVAQQFNGWQSRGLAGAPPPALAAAGAHAAATGHRQPVVAGPPAMATRPPLTVAQIGHPPAGPGEPGFAGPGAPRHHHEAGQGLVTEAAAPHEAAAPQPSAREQMAKQQISRQTMVSDVHRQQEMAAQREAAGRQQAQQREAQMSARQPQLHALAAQRRAEPAGEPESRAQPPVHEHTQPVQTRERQLAPAPRPEAARVPVQRPPEAPRPQPAPRPADAPRPPAPHMEAPRAEPAHPAPGHDNEHHDH